MEAEAEARLLQDMFGDDDDELEEEENSLFLQEKSPPSFKGTFTFTRTQECNFRQKLLSLFTRKCNSCHHHMRVSLLVGVKTLLMWCNVLHFTLILATSEKTKTQSKSKGKSGKKSTGKGKHGNKKKGKSSHDEPRFASSAASVNERAGPEKKPQWYLPGSSGFGPPGGVGE